MAHVVSLGPEKGVGQDHVVDLVQRRVVNDVAVDEEEDGQVDFLAGADLLLFETEALDFGKVGRDLDVSLGSLPGSCSRGERVCESRRGGRELQGWPVAASHRWPSRCPEWRVRHSGDCSADSATDPGL